jgi:hypothetical protein
MLLLNVPLSLAGEEAVHPLPVTFTLALLNVAVVLSLKLLLVGVEAFAVTVQLGKADEVNLAPPFGMLIVS